MVFIVPMLVAIALLITNFNWVMVGLAALLVFLGFFGNSFVRSRLACKYCKQRELVPSGEAIHKIQ